MEAFVTFLVIMVFASFVSRAVGKQGGPPGRRPDGLPRRPNPGHPLGRPEKTVKRLPEGTVIIQDVRWDTRMPVDQIFQRKTTNTPGADPEKAIELSRASGHEGEWGDEGRSLPETWSAEGTSELGLPGTEGSDQSGRPVQAQIRQPAWLVASRDEEPVLGLTGEDLTLGIIWAEVLGRPRALRPFRGPRA